jgi:hypothetical protein
MLWTFLLAVVMGLVFFKLGALVGFPYPDEAHAAVRFLETPATVWGAESVLIDEISRCKPEHQNRLFSLVHERRLQGLTLARLRFRWAAPERVSTVTKRVKSGPAA